MPINLNFTKDTDNLMIHEISKEKIKVIFRKIKYFDGEEEILALFPELCGNYDSIHTCLAYTHCGQHYSDYIFNTIIRSYPAKEYEYRDLKAELESIGYSLDIIQRNRRKFTETRIKKINEIK